MGVVPSCSDIPTLMPNTSKALFLSFLSGRSIATQRAMSASSFSISSGVLVSLLAFGMSFSVFPCPMGSWTYSLHEKQYPVRFPSSSANTWRPLREPQLWLILVTHWLKIFSPVNCFYQHSIICFYPSPPSPCDSRKAMYS